jgi:hypothetical protein
LRSHAHETIFGGWARCPAVDTLAGKPVVRQLVMDVLGEKQRDEHVDVEQRHARGSHRQSGVAETIHQRTCDRRRSAPSADDGHAVAKLPAAAPRLRPQRLSQELRDRLTRRNAAAGGNLLRRQEHVFL